MGARDGRSLAEGLGRAFRAFRAGRSRLGARHRSARNAFGMSSSWTVTQTAGERRLSADPRGIRQESVPWRTKEPATSAEPASRPRAQRTLSADGLRHEKEDHRPRDAPEPD